MPLNLTEATNLRSLTLRTVFGAIGLPNDAILQTLSTIISPFFSEFVLEVKGVPTTLVSDYDARTWWGKCVELDEMFERMNNERGFMLVIRVEETSGESNFVTQAEERLPLMVARKGVVFEVGPFPEK